MKGQLHGRSLVLLGLEGDSILTESQPEEIRIVSIMEYLITHRGQQPALDSSCSRLQGAKEKGVIAVIEVFEPPLSCLSVFPDQVAVLAGNGLKFHIYRRTVIYSWTGDIEEEVLAVLSGKVQVVADVPGFQFKQRQVGLC